MSTQSPFRGRTAQVFPTLPRGDVLGTFDSYPDAQAVVAKLAESDFPVNKLSIVGNELKTVERVTGKMTYGRAALAGALSGLWLGFFFGIVLTLFSPTASGLIFAAALIGAAFGVLYGVVSFAITKRQRDFTSVHQVLATNYQIIVDPQLVGQAQRILGQFGATPHAAWNPGQSSNAPFQGRPPQQQAPQQPQQQPWRPGPDQSSPYGGHATPHNQPGGPGQSGPLAPAPGTQPRYGTNDGPRYGEVPQQGQRPPQQPAAPTAAPAPRADEPPRYGERVPGATPPAPTSDDAPERRQDDDQTRGDDRR
ncbi:MULTISPECIES: general stress protein [unclassified Curtobacterium]|uniref:general stress protein n=1 Tax=unclassified Curtobacterium TaxID=257496 RepID=UPI00226B5A41|nr:MULTISPECIES: general stress protein [unclassified Curtobacterium]